MPAEWGMHTAFHKVFLNLLHPLLIKNRLRHEEMAECRFIFLQFDVAQRSYSRNPSPAVNEWSTTYDVVE